MRLKTAILEGKFSKGKLSRCRCPYLQASLSLPGSPYAIRKGSKGSHTFIWRTGNGKRFGDKKPLVLSTYLDAQEHLPFADDSAAVTPMSEENGAIIVPVYTNLGTRHNSYTSHMSGVSYTSHGDLLNGKPMTKEDTLRTNLLVRKPGSNATVPEVIIDTLDDNQCVSREHRNPAQFSLFLLPRLLDALPNARSCIYTYLHTFFIALFF